jgi:hypothetical protein
MALAGNGAIIIWNDIAPEGRDDFYAWHLNEHIPERLAVPGFLRGSRYKAVTAETSPEFLTLYEISNSDVATSAPYLERLNAPTPWTKRATSQFRNTSRALTHVAASRGPGMGGIMGTIRLDASPLGLEASKRLQRTPEHLNALAGLPRISGVHVCLTNVEASGTKTAESRERSDILAAPFGALLIDGCDEAAVTTALAAAADKFELSITAAQSGLYRLEHVATRGT